MSENMNVVWQPHEGPQTEALSRSEFEILYGGSRGGGKTEAGLAWMVEPNFLQNEMYRGLVIRKNVEDLRDWIDRAKIFYRPLNAKFIGQPSEIRFPGGAIIRTGHLKDENAYEKYQGHEYQKILIEELTQIPQEEQYLRLVSSARSTIGLTPQIFATTNPGGPGMGWVKSRWVDKARGKTYVDPVTTRTRIFIPAKVTDNPTLMKKDPGYIQYLDGLPEELRRAWRDGDWDVFVGQFFKEWRRAVHVVQPFKIPKGWYKYRAIDYGYRAPFCCLWGAVDFDGNVYIYKEHYEAEKELSYHVRMINERSEGENYHLTVGDPSMWARNPVRVTKRDSMIPTHMSIADLMAQAGIPVVKANNNRPNGWAAIREYLHWEGDEEEPSKQPQIFVFENCENLIRTLPSMVFDKNRPEDLNTKTEDHAVDALRYMILQLYSPSKKEIAPWLEKELQRLASTDFYLPGIRA